MKYMWKKLLILGAFIAVSIVFASGSQAASYTIEAYDVKIEVNENNTFYITETIDVYFNMRQHGIYRDIPLNNNITRLDGTSSQNRATVSKISVSEKYSESTYKRGSNKYKRLQIGDANAYVSGSQTYVIEYLYNLGKDPSPDYDELYFNLIGPEWNNTVISNITFTIKMPKDFDAEKLGFSAGRTGSADSSNVYYTVSGNTITGGYDGSLVRGKALTVRLELPEGYFVGAFSLADAMKYLALAVLVLLVLATAVIVIIRLKWGLEDKVAEPVEFYPPDQLNSVDVGFVYHGRVTAKEFTSLFIYLANKGYIEIEEKGKSTLLIKKKEYDGDNDMEKGFMEAVFKNRNRVYLTSLTVKGPENAEFAKAIGTLVVEGNEKEKRLTVFDAVSAKMRKRGYLLLFAALAFYVLLTFMSLGGDSTEISSAFASLVPVFILGVSVKFLIAFIIVSKERIVSRVVGIMIILIAFFLFMKKPLASLPGLIAETMVFPVLYALGLLCTLLAIGFVGGRDKRNAYGQMLYGRIKGFRNFLILAEKPRLEALVMENPSYFYDILPYTYVLNVSKIWIEKFELINLTPPEWYHGTDTAFDASVFCNSIDSIMHVHLTDRLNSSSSSGDSGGGDSWSGGGGNSGSSGGGVSGGGSGGGGGGAW